MISCAQTFSSKKAGGWARIPVHPHTPADHHLKQVTHPLLPNFPITEASPLNPNSSRWGLILHVHPSPSTPRPLKFKFRELPPNVVNKVWFHPPVAWALFAARTAFPFPTQTLHLVQPTADLTSQGICSLSPYTGKFIPPSLQFSFLLWDSLCSSSPLPTPTATLLWCLISIIVMAPERARTKSSSLLFLYPQAEHRNTSEICWHELNTVRESMLTVLRVTPKVLQVQGKDRGNLRLQNSVNSV